MKIAHKIILFIVGFSGIFHLSRAFEYYHRNILLADLGGIPWLYSTIGVIFSIIAAFAIQKEWENWNSLVEAAKSEVDSLEELWIWTGHMTSRTGKKIKELIVEYLKTIIHEGWKKSVKGERSEEAEEILSSLRDELFMPGRKGSEFMRNYSVLLSDILRQRKNRLHYSTRHMPDILHYTLIFSTSLLVGLSLLIGIRNVWLDYIFTLGIATLAFTVYVVISDLDRPLQPGGWHFTTKDYKELLQRIQK